MSKQYNWPLNTLQFTWKDRLKIAAFFLNSKNRWTQGERVKEYEQLWSQYTGCPYVVMTSSGSTANTLLAMRVKDQLKERFHQKKTVIVPALTWQTSVSPWIREGFHPLFVDINLETLSIDTNQLEIHLRNKSEEIACVFITTLLGFVPEMGEIIRLCKQYNVELLMDNCESSLSQAHINHQRKHVCNLGVDSTTSLYLGHNLTTGGEGGLIFTKNEQSYHYYLMARSHGMVRSLIPYGQDTSPYRNEKVYESFDFQLLGNNYRSTDVNAYIGALDFKRKGKYATRRKELYKLFCKNLNEEKFLIVYPSTIHYHVPFCIPIILKEKNNDNLNKIISYLDKNFIEWRGILGGNLLRHVCYSGYGEPKDFPNSEMLSDHGIYVGLHSSVKEKDVLKLLDFLNQI